MKKISIMKKIISCKINLKRSQIRSYVKAPKSVLKKTYDGKWPSQFEDLNKINKIIFRFELDEKNKTILNLDSYPQSWHGIYKKENLKLNEDYSTKSENLYNCHTSRWWRPYVPNTTELYKYIISVSNKSGMRITANVYFAHHKLGNEPKFKLYDSFYIVMDCVEVISSEEAQFQGLSKELREKIMNKTSMMKAIEILKKDAKKPKQMFSRRMQKYEEVLKYNDRYDLKKLATCLSELKYEFLKESQYSADIMFFNFFEQFYIFYATNKNISALKAVAQVLAILEIPATNKKIEKHLYQK